MLIDTHAHLTYDDVDVKAMVSAFPSDGVAKVFTVGWNYESSKQCVELSDKYDSVYAIVGVHPSDISTLNDDVLEKIKDLSSNKKVLAIGEIGLDYHYGIEEMDLQKKGLVAQLQLAHELQLPVVFHVRDATSDIIDLLVAHKHLITHGSVVHCFNEDIEIYHTYKKHFPNMKFSIGGAITFKNATQLQHTVSHMDINDILLETDSPYITPVPFRGKEKNQPKYVVYVAQKIAELKNTTLEEIINITTKNTYEVFTRLSK